MHVGHTDQSIQFISHDLASWVHGLTFEQLSPSAIERAKLFWLDSLACAAEGSQTEDAAILLEHHRDMGGVNDSGACALLFTSLRANPVDATFLNSHMVRAMDFNDIYWKADPCHPSDLICGPLALCEQAGLGGRELILATVILYELQCRFAEIGRPGLREYGWHHATLSGFASALGAGRVLALSPEQLVNAIGISASRTGTLGAVTAGTLTMMKNTVDPWAARMGVESALLARRGFTGPAHIIDGKEGLFHVMGHATVAGERASFDAAGLTRNLPRGPKDAYRIEECSMKSVPVEALMHSPISALSEILHQQRVRPKEVRELRVEVIARAADILGDPAKYRPTTRETADHSLPYALAVLIADGELGPAQFDPRRVNDPSLRPLMDAVRVIANEEFESRFPAAQPSRVTLTTHDGTTLSAHVEHPKGHPQNPMTPQDVRRKFHTLASPVLGQSTCDRVAELVEQLESLNDVRALTSLLRRGQPDAATDGSTTNMIRDTATKNHAFA
ncbi:MAG: MmgE/PrpD family protein [Phycisphaerales bacterium]|jgi:2-methylcitrate dehydratase|nr:MmgE/PrpD family protein [Phycisphaerales bacterium]